MLQLKYSKPMIDLVYEIRRRVESDIKPAIKLANPEMLQEVARIYQHSNDIVTKTLIKELLTLAGDTWLQQINTAEPAVDMPRQTTKVYRGQVSLVETPPLTTTAQLSPEKPTRIYRGQVVDY